MRGFVLHCPNPNCKKLLMKDCNFPNETQMKTKCYHCGNLIEIKSNKNKIYLKDITESEMPEILVL